jgi:hypothetical protein
MTWSCRVLGHRPSFHAEGRTMRGEWARGCGPMGSKLYPTVREARRYAAAFNRRDTADIGTRAPLIGLFPLRLWRALRRAR